jgi:hypothetical protein
MSTLPWYEKTISYYLKTKFFCDKFRMMIDKNNVSLQEIHHMSKFVGPTLWRTKEHLCLAVVYDQKL